MIYDFDTGEILKDKFAQLYFKDIQKLFNIAPSSMCVLFLMVKQVGLGNSSSLNMHPKRKKEFANELNFKTYRTVDKALKELEMNDIIKRLEKDEYPHKYTINPDILFSGNDYQRAKILIEYSDGKRNVKAFNSEEALMRYLQEK